MVAAARIMEDCKKEIIGWLVRETGGNGPLVVLV
jgi:hypothetical protein